MRRCWECFAEIGARQLVCSAECWERYRSRDVARMAELARRALPLETV